MNNESQPNTLEELNALQKFFSNAESELKAGRIVDMSGIDQRISKVCQAVQQAKPDLQQMFLPELTTLIELLGDYEKELRKIQAAFANHTTPSANDDPKS